MIRRRLPLALLASFVAAALASFMWTGPVGAQTPTSTTTTTTEPPTTTTVPPPPPAPEPPPGLGKAERNRLKAEKVLRSGPAAWLIKLADRIDNLRDACRLDDGPESLRFCVRYQEDTAANYLPLAERLGNNKVLAALTAALSPW